MCFKVNSVQSLVIEVPGLKWGDDDSKDQMLGRALTYLVLYSTLGMMVSSDQIDMRSMHDLTRSVATLVVGSKATISSR